MSLRQNILNFARPKRGHRVGDGQCWTFVETALRTAGAKTSNDVMGPENVVDDADYVWGDPVTLASLQPGDIIQFRDYSYTSTGDDGSITVERPHHTAIVSAVGANGQVTVLEQNIDDTQVVRQNTLYLRDGSFGGRSVTVTGQMWFYRALPK